VYITHVMSRKLVAFHEPLIWPDPETLIPRSFAADPRKRVPVYTMARAFGEQIEPEEFHRLRLSVLRRKATFRNSGTLETTKALWVPLTQVWPEFLAGLALGFGAFWLFHDWERAGEGTLNKLAPDLRGHSFA
jgi:hypothetical protein